MYSLKYSVEFTSPSTLKTSPASERCSQNPVEYGQTAFRRRPDRQAHTEKSERTEVIERHFCQPKHYQ